MLLRQPRRAPTAFTRNRRFLFGPLHSAKIDVAPETFTLQGLELQLIATPGHCPGHLCVFIPQNGWLFSGDLFVAPNLDTQLPDETARIGSGAWKPSFLLPVTALFDAHGTVVHGMDEVRRLLARKRDFLRSIEVRVGEHLEAATSIEDLSNRYLILPSCRMDCAGRRMVIGFDKRRFLTASSDRFVCPASVTPTRGKIAGRTH